jgi:uncharacterized protein (UPF0218 family)
MSTESSPSEFDEDFPEHDLYLPDELREELSRQIGEIVPDDEIVGRLKGRQRVVCVGDIVTMTLLQRNIEPDVAVFDYRTQRSEDEGAKERIAGMRGDLIRVRNPQGMITRDLWRAVRDAVRGQTRVKIEVAGEEDLAALVAIACSPEGTCVIYGLPGKGLMLVPVDDASRAFANRAVRRMRW